MNHEVKQGTVGEPIAATLIDVGGPVSIAGALVELNMKRMDGTGPLLGGVAANLDDGSLANRGAVSYTWQAADTATPGFYYFEWRVTFAPGSPQQRVIYVPDGGYDTVEVVAHLQ